jgi:FkbM family methyltransferase
MKQQTIGLIKRVINKLGRVVVLITPSKYKLPLIHKLELLNSSCENELKNLHRICSKTNTAIDVGANQGYFTYSMSKLFSKVYAFEINEDLTKNIASYNPGNIEIINKGLSSKTENTILYIPIVDDFVLTGWASLTPNNCPNAQKHLKKQVQICPLDTFNINDVSFVKIDVEGHELEVLKGAIQTITSYRPVILIEIKESNLNAVDEFFKQLNYLKYKLEDLIGIPGSKENYIYVPE